LFLAAIGRTLQPTNHEPSRTMDALVTWFLGFGGVGLLVVLVVLPFVAILLALGLLLRAWATDEGLRSDLIALGRSVLRPSAGRDLGGDRGGLWCRLLRRALGTRGRGVGCR